MIKQHSTGCWPDPVAQHTAMLVFLFLAFFGAIFLIKRSHEYWLRHMAARAFLKHIIPDNRPAPTASQVQEFFSRRQQNYLPFLQYCFGWQTCMCVCASVSVPLSVEWYGRTVGGLLLFGFWLRSDGRGDVREMHTRGRPVWPFGKWNMFCLSFALLEII